MCEDVKPYGTTAVVPTDGEALDDLEEVFTYHAPRGTQARRYVILRDAAKDLARLMIYNTVPSRELTRSLEHLQQAIMWVNSGIARREGEHADLAPVVFRDTDPPEPPAPTHPPAIAYLLAVVADLIAGVEAELGAEGCALYQTGAEHYVRMYRAFRGGDPTHGEVANSYTMAAVRGVGAGKLPDSRFLRALCGLLEDTVARNVPAPKVRLERPDVLGRLERPINASEEWLYVPRTGGGGQLPPGPADDPPANP